MLAVARIEARQTTPAGTHEHRASRVDETPVGCKPVPIIICARISDDSEHSQTI